MKMQEVIVRLRELAPAAAENTAFAESLMCELVGVMEDMQNATTLTAVKAIAAEAFKQSLVVQQHIVHATKAAKALQELNESYKEKLGPRAKKSGDDPRQPELPGIAERRPGSSSCSGDCSPTCPRGKTSAVACEYCDNGVCRGVVYPTNPPQHDPCVFCPGTNARQ